MFCKDDSSDEICELLNTKKKEQSGVYNASLMKNVQVKKSNIKRQKLCEIHTKRIHQVVWELKLQSKYVWQKEVKATLTFNCCCDEAAVFLVKLDRMDVCFQKLGVMDSSTRQKQVTSE